jgi:hypothetical protein
VAKVVLDEESLPTTPASGSAAAWFDTTGNGLFCTRDDSGRVAARTRNASIAAQSAGGFAVDTYVTDSDLLIPSFGLQVRTTFTWQISASKTAAGVATPIYVVQFGANRSTADTDRLTLTGPAQTAVIDIGTLNILVVVRSIGASGVLQGTAWWDHRGTAANTTTSGTGFANDVTGHVEATAAGFDMSALAGQYVSLSINGGGSAAWTVTQVRAEVDW